MDEVEGQARVRYFTPAEANQVLPALIVQMGQARELLARSRGLVVAAAVGRSDRELDEVRAESRALQEQIRALIEDIHERGVQVKGIDPGLLDFPALRHGLEVLLCWKEGEARIGFWHPLSTGLKGRQPIEETSEAAWEWCN